MGGQARNGLIVSGKIIEAAWHSYAESVLPAKAPPVQFVECRRAFYAGANALFGGLMTILDPGDEPTEADLDRMREIQSELEGFVKDMGEGRT